MSIGGDLLRKAIKEKDYRELEKLLKEIDPDDPHLFYDELPLIVALREGTPRQVEVVLRAGADPNGRGLAMEALWAKEEDALENLKLLLRYGASVDKVNSPLTVLFRIAEREKDAEKFWRALKPYLLPVSDSLPEGWKESFLKEVAHRRRGNLLKALSRDGFDFNVRLDGDCTLLHIWAEGCFDFEKRYPISIRYRKQKEKLPDHHFEETQRSLYALLSHGLDINAQDARGNTPLHYACASGERLEVLELLLQRGADPRIKNHEGRSPLFELPVWATPSFEALLRYGGDPKEKDHKGTPLLMHLAKQFPSEVALIESYLDSLRLLLQEGADPREKDPEKGSFLSFLLSEVGAKIPWFSGASVKRAFCELVEEALKRGADPNEPDQAGGNPLYYAISLGSDPHYLPLVRALLEAGADPNVRYATGETPAHLAAISGKADLLLLLGEFGADLSAKNAEGESVASRYIENSQSWNPDEISRLVSLGMDFKDKNILFHLVERWREGDKTIRDFVKNATTFLVKEVGLSLNDRWTETVWKGNTPLHFACARRKGGFAQLLVQLGAQPWLTNLEGQTPGDLLTLAKRQTLSPEPEIPKWAIESGILPLKERNVLLDILKDDGKHGTMTPAIKRFIYGLAQDSILAFMDLVPHVLSLPSDHGAVKFIKEIIEEGSRKVSLEKRGGVGEL